MKIKKVLVSIGIVLLLIAAGCWDSTELRDVSMVAGIGIDRIPGDEPILLTIEIINHAAAQSGAKNGSGTEEKPFHILSSKGKTFSDAKGKFARVWPREISFSHNKVIIFGKDFAAGGITEVVDFLGRDREIRRRNRILIAKETAGDVVATEIAGEMLPTEVLEKILNRFEATAVVYPINLNEFILRLKSEAKTTFAPVVELRNSELVIEETGIIEDGRLIGILNANASEGLLWLLNKGAGDIVVLESKKTDAEVTIEITRAKTTIIPKITNAGIFMEIKCTGDAVLREAEKYLFEIQNVADLANLETKAESILKNKVEKTIMTAQQDLKADFIGFADQIYNYNPQKWKQIKKNWDKLFPNVAYIVEFDISIVNIGLVKDSLIIDLEREE